MSYVVISRCRNCPVIIEHAQEVKMALGDELHLKTWIVDGVEREFAVWVEDILLLHRNRETLPTAREVTACVEHALEVLGGR